MEVRQRFAILNEKKKIIKSICPDITTNSGIYAFHRIDENGKFCIYMKQTNQQA